MKNEYKVDKALIMSWAKEYVLVGAKNYINLVILSLVLLCGILMIVLLSFIDAPWYYWAIAIAYLSIAVYKLFFAHLVLFAKRYKAYARSYGMSEWTRTIELLENEIVMNDATSRSVICYENIRKIVEKGNTVVLILHDNMALRLYKDAFVEGDWESCRRMLEEKMK